MVVGLLAATISLHLLSHGEDVQLGRPLRDFPLVLGSWQGYEDPIEQPIVKAAAVDDYLNRTYEQVPTHSGGSWISLYIGYYKSQRTGEGIHSPRNCLPGEGWEPQSETVSQLALPGGGAVPVNLYVIQKGSDRELVIYWYQSHGRIVASEYWSKIYLVLDAIRYNRTDAALIRIITSIDRDEQSANERAISFARQAIVPLQSILPH